MSAAGTSPMSTSASPMNRWGGPQGNSPTWVPQHIQGGAGQPQGINPGGVDVTPRGPGAQQPQGNMPTWVPQQIGGGNGGNPQGNMPTWTPQYIGGGNGIAQSNFGNAFGNGGYNIQNPNQGISMPGLNLGGGMGLGK